MPAARQRGAVLRRGVRRQRDDRHARRPGRAERGSAAPFVAVHAGHDEIHQAPGHRVARLHHRGSPRVRTRATSTRCPSRRSSVAVDELVGGNVFHEQDAAAPTPARRRCVRRDAPGVGRRRRPLRAAASARTRCRRRRRGTDADGAAHQPRQPLADRQPEAGARRADCRARCRAARTAGTAAPHPARGCAGPDRARRAAAPAGRSVDGHHDGCRPDGDCPGHGELHRVADEVHQHLPQPAGSRHGRAPARRRPMSRTSWMPRILRLGAEHVAARLRAAGAGRRRSGASTAARLPSSTISRMSLTSSSSASPACRGGIGETALRRSKPRSIEQREAVDAPRSAACGFHG